MPARLLRPGDRIMMASTFSLLYDGLVTLAVAVFLRPLERLKILRGVASRRDLDERLGRWRGTSRAAHRRVLIHAVSAGEVAAAGALIAAIDSGIACVVTTGNPAGRAAASRLARQLPAIEAVAYLPWDRRRNVRTWLEAVRPDAVVLIEAEIWPNLLGACRDMEIPVSIVNGRIARRDVARYGLARGFFVDVLRAVEWFGVASERDRQAFEAIGAPAHRIEVIGNLKADAPISDSDIPEDWARVLDDVPGPVIVAGSTHPGEHLPLLEAFCGVRSNHPEARLILAPRHPESCAGGTIGAGLRTVCWSHGSSRQWDVLVVDRLGVLAPLYRWADIAFIGGSLVDHGGHSPFEAAAAGTAIVIGPFYEHWTDEVEGMREVGAVRIVGRSVDGFASLRSAFEALLNDPVVRSELGSRARQCLESRRGAAAHAARRLTARVGAGSSSGRASTGTARETP